jgi:hypothetical protein
VKARIGTFGSRVTPTAASRILSPSKDVARPTITLPDPRASTPSAARGYAYSAHVIEDATIAEVLR